MTHMSHTPTLCKTGCGSVARYRIGTSPEYGPQVAFANPTKTHKTLFCLPCARERQADLAPAWEARQEAKRTKALSNYEAWVAYYKATTETNQGA